MGLSSYEEGSLKTEIRYLEKMLKEKQEIINEKQKIIDTMIEQNKNFYALLEKYGILIPNKGELK
jgi:hypothetical protein